MGGKGKSGIVKKGTQLPLKTWDPMALSKGEERPAGVVREKKKEGRMEKEKKKKNKKKNCKEGVI